MKITDMNDNEIEIGTIVTWTEFFAEGPDSDKTYIVTDIINCGDMVEIAQVVWVCPDPIASGDADETGIWVKLDEAGDTPMEVEPYKIGAI